MAKKVKARSRSRASVSKAQRQALSELRGELTSIEQELRTSTVSFSRRRLRTVLERLDDLLEPASELSKK